MENIELLMKRCQARFIFEHLRFTNKDNYSLLLFNVALIRYILYTVCVSVDVGGNVLLR